jgi:hypothetical protein
MPTIRPCEASKRLTEHTAERVGISAKLDAGYGGGC